MKNVLFFLLMLAIASCDNQPISFIKTFQGDLANKPVVMKLRANEGLITGSYFYKKGTGEISLKGTINKKGETRLEEYVNGTLTGIFEGMITSSDLFSGHWSSPTGSKNFDFFLEVTGTDYEQGASKIKPDEEIPTVKFDKNIDLTGEWNVFIDCTESTCSYSRESERFNEQWTISGTENLKVLVRGSEHKVKAYSGQFNDGKIILGSTSIGLLTKYTKSRAVLIPEGDNVITGEIILNSPSCSSNWKVKLTRESPSVKF